MARFIERTGHRTAIALEDLQVNNMSASDKGAVEAPGRDVRQKAGLNGGILDDATADGRRAPSANDPLTPALQAV